MALIDDQVEYEMEVGSSDEEVDVESVEEDEVRKSSIVKVSPHAEQSCIQSSAASVPNIKIIPSNEETTGSLSVPNCVTSHDTNIAMEVSQPASQQSMVSSAASENHVLNTAFMETACQSENVMMVDASTSMENLVIPTESEDDSTANNDTLTDDKGNAEPEQNRIVDSDMLASNLLKAISTSSFTANLSEEKRVAFAKRNLGSNFCVIRANDQRLTAANTFRTTPKPFDSFTEQPTERYINENDIVFRCKGVKGVGFNGACDFECGSYGSLMKHRQDSHWYPPRDDQYYLDRTGLLASKSMHTRSKAKYVCLKLSLGSDNACKKSFSSLQDIADHFKDVIHEGEIVVVQNFCVVCNTSFPNAEDLLHHGIRNECVP